MGEEKMVIYRYSSVAPHAYLLMPSKVKVRLAMKPGLLSCLVAIGQREEICQSVCGSSQWPHAIPSVA